jgi:hypothetical protein
MENLFKNFDFATIAKTIIILPTIISLIVVLILYLIDILKNRKLSYLNICLKVVACYYAVVFAILTSLFAIKLIYGKLIIFKVSKSDIFSGLYLFLISTFFLLLIFLLTNFIMFILFKVSLIKNNNISIYKIINPVTYFIFSLIFLLSFFWVLKSSTLNSPKTKNKIQKVAPSLVVER